jgi:hypothetical protein
VQGIFSALLPTAVCLITFSGPSVSTSFKRV